MVACISVIPMLQQLRQEDPKFLKYIMSSRTA